MSAHYRDALEAIERAEAVLRDASTTGRELAIVHLSKAVAYAALSAVSELDGIADELAEMNRALHRLANIAKP
jgi:Tfp pilus assembly protein PilX